MKILLDGRDILKSGVDTKPGQEIKDVTIVIGEERTAASARVPSGDAHDAAEFPSSSGSSGPRRYWKTPTIDGGAIGKLR